MFFPAIVGLLVLVGLVVFFWVHNGPGSGRPFGNRVAAHIGMPKSVFYALLENGVEGSPRELLASLQRSKLGLEEAGVKLGPTLGRGLARLERRLARREFTTEQGPLLPDLSQQLKNSDAATPTPCAGPAGDAHPPRDEQRRLALQRGKRQNTHVLIACSDCWVSAGGQKHLKLQHGGW